MTDKLNPLGETIRLIERERLAQARAGVNGWTPATDDAQPAPPAPRQKPNPAHFYRQRLRNAQDRLRAAEARLARLTAAPEPRGNLAEHNLPWSRNRDRAAEYAIDRGMEIADLESTVRYLRGRVATYTQRLKELEVES